MSKDQKPILGFGLGLRTEHYDTILEENPKIDWFEILSENYLVPGGKPIYYLEQICERYPVVMHGVSMSIGGSDPLDWEYLKQIKTLAEKTKAHWLSDHLCWTGIEGKNLHDLMPMPYTDEAVKHVAKRIREVQDFLERRILIENVSSYVNYQQSTMTEWEFVSRIAEESDSLMLLDINNIYVSSVNHEFDPMDYINNVPAERVYQYHLAGHLNLGTHIIDTHDHDVVKPVWKLYEETLKRVGFVSTMIERDDNIPPLAEVMKELDQAKKIAKKVFKMDPANKSRDDGGARFPLLPADSQHCRPGNREAQGRHPGNREAQGRHPGNLEAQGRHPGNREAQGLHPGNREAQGRHPGNREAQGRHPGNREAQGSRPGNREAQGRHPGNREAIIRDPSLTEDLTHV